MKQKNLFLLVGVPGSGKSYFCNKKIAENKNTIHISRDEIRFSMLGEDENYFAQEAKVFECFAEQVQKAIDSIEYTDIYVDATHLNPKGREKILDCLDLSNVNIIPIVFHTPLATCISRNNNREGRAKVPSSVIRRMYFSLKNPTLDEKYKYKKIIEVS